MTDFTTSPSVSELLKTIGFLEPCMFYWVLVDAKWVCKFKKEIYIFNEDTCLHEGVICKYFHAYVADELKNHIPECVRLEKNFQPNPESGILETYYICGEIGEEEGALCSWSTLVAGHNTADSYAQLIIFIKQSEQNDII